MASSSILATENVGVNALESVKIYPNPAKDFLNIELPKDIKDFNFEVTDLVGHVLIKDKNNTHINVESLTKGAYIGKLTSKDHVTVRKILIK
ncbi:T9SS type A sorting domain-containing protein [Chryseobacterium wanjuense]